VNIPQECRCGWKAVSSQDYLTHHCEFTRALFPGEFRFFRDPEHNAATIIGPFGKKVRLSFFPDGRVRLRVSESGNMHIQEFWNGQGKQRSDASVTLAPEGWVKPAKSSESDKTVAEAGDEQK